MTPNVVFLHHESVRGQSFREIVGLFDFSDPDDEADQAISDGSKSPSIPRKSV